MSNKSVVVLAPNGRRQNVKVTPNTTILQILEEVCKKQGLKAEEFDIKHHNKVLDATAIMRFTGLPNNAQLEMAAAVKVRAETRVKVGLALESGDRVMGEFEPSDSLWHVVTTLCPSEAKVDEATDVLPVIFYMGREESGTVSLAKTRLRDLGLTGGGAILRFFKKTSDELHRQANVSAPLSRPQALSKESFSRPSTSGLVQKTSSTVPITSDRETSSNHSSSASNAAKEPPVQHAAPQVSVAASVEQMVAEPSTVESKPEPIESTSTEPSKSEAHLKLLKDKSGSELMDIDYEDSSGADTQVSSTPSTSTSERLTSVTKVVEQPEETIVFLGERNAVLFDMATARACKPEDVPDDFFDLTLDDAKQLLRDMKRRQAALEEQPLVTRQYRDLEKSKQMLCTLNQYKRCVVRIQFPNQLVLQGTFTPLEKVSHVIEFVKKYLDDPSIDFQIFMTPPKTVLSAEQTLYDANCVPGAVVHFMSGTKCAEHGSYIRKDVMDQVSTLSAAAAAAQETRSINQARMSSSSLDTDESVSSHQVAAPTPSQKPPSVTVDAPRPSTSGNVAGTCSGVSGKVPKWFKPAK